MKDINIYLIRHGESEHNANMPDIIGQAPDTKLTSRGVNQAGRLGKRLLDEKIEFDYVFSSTYDRAMVTAQIVSKIARYKKDIIYTDALREYDAGDWKGKKRSETIFGDLNVAAKLATLHMGFPFPNGETLHQVERRTSSYIEDNIIHNKEVLALAENKIVNIAVFSHGQALKCILHYIMGFDASFLWKLRLWNTSISRVKYGDRGWILHSINDCAHLRYTSSW